MPRWCASRTKRLERVRAAVGAFDGEQVGRVVAPRIVAGELGHRHHLDDVDAEPLQVVEAARCRREVAGTAVVVGLERADMHLVDHQFVVTRQLERHRPASRTSRGRRRRRCRPSWSPAAPAGRCGRPRRRRRRRCGTCIRRRPSRRRHRRPSGRCLRTASGARSSDQSLKLPLTATLRACGAQTRKATPPSCNTAPIPSMVTGPGGSGWDMQCSSGVVVVDQRTCHAADTPVRARQRRSAAASGSAWASNVPVDGQRPTFQGRVSCSMHHATLRAPVPVPQGSQRCRLATQTAYSVPALVARAGARTPEYP